MSLKHPIMISNVRRRKHTGLEKQFFNEIFINEIKQNFNGDSHNGCHNIVIQV